MLRHQRFAFTLVELLVVIAIIGMLVGILLPAVQGARESARRTQCLNRMRQLALGVLSFNTAIGHYPPSATLDTKATETGNNVSWGVHGRILPYLEEANVADRIDLEAAWDFQTAIDGLQIASLQCPSDPGASLVRDPGSGRVKLFPTTYGFNMGTWFVYDPATQTGGDGMFYPNSNLQTAHVKDGLSRTMMVSEVKAWQPYVRNGGPSSTTIPNTSEQAAAITASGAQFKNTGHTEWPDGRVHHTGFTATLPPNTKVPYEHEGETLDADYNSWQEGKDGVNGNATYAIITARSFHSGQVNVAMMDGSVKGVSSDIDLAIWRGAATRANRETTDLE